MALSDRIAGSRPGYHWIDSRSSSVRAGLFLVSLASFLGLGMVLPEAGGDPTATVVVGNLAALLAIVVALFAAVSLLHTWYAEQPQSVGFGAFVGTLVAYLFLPREVLFGVVGVSLSVLLLVISGLVIRRTVGAVRQSRTEGDQ